MNLGDLRESGLKQIMLEVEVDENFTENLIDILQYELTYHVIDVNFLKEGPIKGSLQMKMTRDINELNELSDEVTVYLQINECSELDKQVVIALDYGDIEQAIEIKKRVVKILTDLTQKDTLGFAKVLLMKAETRVEELEKLRYNTSNLNLVRKAVYKEAQEEEDEDMGFGLFD